MAHGEKVIYYREGFHPTGYGFELVTAAIGPFQEVTGKEMGDYISRRWGSDRWTDEEPADAEQFAKLALQDAVRERLAQEAIEQEIKGDN